MNTPTYLPKCPNHGCALEACGFPLPKKGTGVCPVSKCSFDFEIDIDETEAGVVKNKDGSIGKRSGWKIHGKD